MSEESVGQGKSRATLLSVIATVVAGIAVVGMGYQASYLNQLDAKVMEAKLKAEAADMGVATAREDIKKLAAQFAEGNAALTKLSAKVDGLEPRIVALEKRPIAAPAPKVKAAPKAKAAPAEVAKVAPTPVEQAPRVESKVKAETVTKAEQAAKADMLLRVESLEAKTKGLGERCQALFDALQAMRGTKK